MRFRTLAASSLLLVALRVHAQVPITTGSYWQDFGTADITSWTNNSTYLGWYQSQGTLGAHVSITAAAPVNTGGFYTYECNGNNDQKIGSRASGSATLVRYGLVLRNQTGLPIRSIHVRYTGFQLSLAQNGNNVNVTTFDYITSASIPSIGGAATAAVPDLDFSQLQNSGVAGSNQISGYPCNRSGVVSACITLPTPLPNNSYILLRWNDVDNAQNDHHMAIDDVQVDFDLTGNACFILLPIELLEFAAKEEGAAVRLNWSTASELNNDRFVVERSADGLAFEPVVTVPGAGNSVELLSYTALDEHPLAGLSYYRLRQVDSDGATSLSPVVAVHFSAAAATLLVAPSISADGHALVHVPDHLVGAEYAVYDAAGRVVLSGIVDGPQLPLDLQTRGAGCYHVRVAQGAQLAIGRLVVGIP